MSLFPKSIARNGTLTNVDFLSNLLNATPLIIVFYVTLGSCHSRHDSVKQGILLSFVKVVPSSQIIREYAIRFARLYFLAFALDRYNLSMEISVIIGYPIDLRSSGLDTLGFQIICIG
jgi:hypothetical protein